MVWVIRVCFETFCILVAAKAVKVILIEYKLANRTIQSLIFTRQLFHHPIQVCWITEHEM